MPNIDHVETGEMYNIEPLSRDTLHSALELLRIALPYDSQQVLENGLSYPESGLLASLDKKNYGKFLEKRGVQDLQYFLLTDENRNVVGIIGYYVCNKDANEAAWIGWFGIHPSVRGKKLGGKLLSAVENLARQNGKKYLRLYTSLDPNEAAAQNLYDKVGLKVVKIEDKLGEPYTLIYREKDLHESKPPLVDDFTKRVRAIFDKSHP